MLTVDAAQNDANSHVLSIYVGGAAGIDTWMDTALSALTELCSKISRELGEVTTKVDELHKNMDALEEKVSTLENEKAPCHSSTGRKKLPKDISVSFAYVQRVLVHLL